MVNSVVLLLVLSAAVSLQLAASSSTLKRQRSARSSSPIRLHSWALSKTPNRASIAVPTAAQKSYQQAELGAIIHFNMATFDHSQGCGAKDVPDVSLFNPTRLNTDQWLQSIVDFGAKYAVLVAKHNCGFCTWPTAVRFPEAGFVYNYSVNFSKSHADVVGSFIESCKKYGVKPGFYYSVVTNSFLNVQSGTVQGGPLAPGQLNVSQELYERIVYAQLTELWTNYGELFEIWFDGSYPPSMRAGLQSLVAQLQPGAVIFNGYNLTANPTRWIGNEGGVAPVDSWSATDDNTCQWGGAGSPNGSVWCPAECDYTMQNGDTWFYDPTVGVHTLSELVDTYHESVGHNGNWLIDLAPTADGVLPDEAVTMYKAIGGWIRQCYGKPVNATSGQGTVVLLELPPGSSLDRVVIQEDITFGHHIRGYQVHVEVDGIWQLASRGHTVGHKKIDLFAAPLLAARAMLVVSRAVATPLVVNFAAHLCDRLEAAAL